MSDELLGYYNRELSYLRELGKAFSHAHPKIAGRLRITPETVEDPHVSRLIESVAFLNARVRKKLDDDFPELTDAMLSVLYPHFLAPIPSMAVVQFECDPELTTGYDLRAGTMLETERIDGEPCRFRTAFPTTAWPVRVESVRLMSTPFVAPVSPRSASCSAVLSIRLRTATAGASFAVLNPRSLRFFLEGQEHHVHALYELLFNHVVDIAIADSAKDSAARFLDANTLRPVGFEPDEGLLPYPKRSFIGYRLLTEFFAFPTKFRFLEFTRLPSEKLRRCGATLELFVYLNRTSAELEQAVTSNKVSFALGCTPIVNLFRHRCESETMTHTQSEYHVVPDSRRPRAIEIYSVDHVTARGSKGESTRYFPFFGLDHGGSDDKSRAWWYASRRAAPPILGKRDDGTEVYLSLVDLDFHAKAHAGWTLDVEATCLNRDLPARLPVSPKLTLSDGGGAVRGIRCLTPPTATLRPPRGGGAAWRLVSHLNLNQLSLTGGESGTDALREILRLYDVRGSDENRDMIEGVLSVQARESSTRVVIGGIPGFCRGTDIAVHLDEQRFAGSGVYLFGCVLERFLALYCTINSYVRLAITTNTRPGELRRWKPRAGDRTLI